MKSNTNFARGKNKNYLNCRCLGCFQKANCEALNCITPIVAAFRFTVVSRCVRPDALMTYAGLLGSGFKENGGIPLCIGKPVGKCKAIVSLYIFRFNSPAGYRFTSLSRKSAEE